MRTPIRLLAGGATVLALTAGALFAGVLAGSPSDGAPAVRPPQAISESAFTGFAPTGAQAAIERLEESLRATPRDAGALAALGLAYQLRWRETGDAGYLPRSEAALERALRSTPDDPSATLGLGNLALIRHDFRHALALGRKARALAPAPPAPTAWSETPRSSSAATTRRLRPSSGWSRASPVSPRMHASRTRVSCSATRAVR